MAVAGLYKIMRAMSKQEFETLKKRISDDMYSDAIGICSEDAMVESAESVCKACKIKHICDFYATLYSMIMNEQEYRDNEPDRIRRKGRGKKDDNQSAIHNQES